MIKKIWLTWFIFLFFLNVNAQPNILQSPCSSSSQGNIGNIIISYTVGEMVLVDTKTFSNIILTQGIIQPETVATNTNIDYGNFLTGEVLLFSNPTPDVINIQLQLLKKGTILLSLVDITGRKILFDKFDYTGLTTKKYNLSKYASGTYILKIEFTTGNIADKRTGSFKVIKTN